MKKIYLFIAFALMAIAASAQEPLYTFSTSVTNVDSWGEDYASNFAFKGTKVDVEVYDGNYVIIKNWAGAEGCDLKVEYDPNIVVDENNYGNIISVTNIINGEEVEPVMYTSGDYSYCDFQTGREDYAILSTTLNEDATLYYSWLEVDKENKMGYVMLTGYFMTSDYSDYNKNEYYYYVEWPQAASEEEEETAEEPLYTFSTSVTNVDSWGEDYASNFAFKGTKVDVEVYDGNYVIIKNWAGAEGCDLKVEYDPNIVVDENNYGNIISVTNIINGEEVEPVMYTSGDYSYCDFQTGREDYAILSTTLNEDATLYYSWLEVDKENKMGYVMLTGYFMTSDYSDYNKNEYYYYVEWPQAASEEEEETAEEPLYTFSTSITNVDSWGEDYASNFAFKGTKVDVEVYDGNYVIIKNWAGAEGCDLKVEYDPNIVVDENNYGNIISVTNIINGEEVEPTMYVSGDYSYCDFQTGREDYAILSTTLNEDATLYYSWLEVDKENKMGYVMLTGYFMTSDYSDYNKNEYYYYVEWPQATSEEEEETAEEPLYTFSTSVTNVDSWGEDYASNFAFKGTKVDVEVYDGNYVIIKNWAGAEGCDLKVEYDPNIVVDENNYGNIISVTNIINGEEVEPTKYVSGDYSYCDFQTGREDYAILSTTLNEDATLYYSWLEVDKENKMGYVVLTGYFMTSDYSDYNKNEYYYYVEWPATDTGISNIRTNGISDGATFNLAGMRVNDNYKGIVIKNGKKMIVK